MLKVYLFTSLAYWVALSFMALAEYGDDFSDIGSKILLVVVLIPMCGIPVLRFLLLWGAITNAQS